MGNQAEPTAFPWLPPRSRTRLSSQSSRKPTWPEFAPRSRTTITPSPNSSSLGSRPQLSHDLAQALLVPLYPPNCITRLAKAEHQAVSSDRLSGRPMVVDFRHSTIKAFALG